MSNVLQDLQAELLARAVRRIGRGEPAAHLLRQLLLVQERLERARDLPHHKSPVGSQVPEGVLGQEVR